MQHPFPSHRALVGRVQFHLPGQSHPIQFTDYVIKNDAGDGTQSGSPPSLRFWGQFWDPANASVNAIEGPNVTLMTDRQAVMGNFSDGSPNQRHLTVDTFNGGKLVFEDCSNGNTWEFDPGTGKASQPLMGAAPPNPDAGDWYLDDGTNTSSGTPGMRVYDGVAWNDQN